MAWLLVAAGMTYVGAAAVTRADRVTPASFNGYATGTALHVTGLQSGGTRLADVDLAFSGAATRSNGLTPQTNEFDVTVTPTKPEVPIAGKAASGRGSGLELGLGQAVPVQPATRAAALTGIAEATAPPDSPLITENAEIPVDPLVFARLLEGQAQAKFGNLLDRCPTTPLADPFGFGRGFAADAQLVNGGAALPDGSMEAPLLSTDTPTETVTETRSRVFAISNGDGTFGLRAVIESEAVPVRINLPPDADTTNDVIIEVGRASLTLTVTGKPGGASIVYSPPPTPNVIIGGAPVVVVPPIIIPIPGVLEVAIAEDQPRAIGGAPGSTPTQSADGTTVSAAVDGVRISIPPALPIPVDPQLVDLRVQHFEGALRVPAGGFSFNDCGVLRVRKVAGPDVTGPFTFNVACTPPAGGSPFTLSASERTFELANGQSKDISVPTGSRCTVTEPGRGTATTTTITESPPPGNPVVANDANPTDGAVTIPAGLRAMTVTFTNSNLGNLQVFKTSQRGLDGPFTFSTSCLTPAGGAVPLAAADANFTLVSNANRVISGIPGGSSCTVTETDRGGAAVTRITDTTAPNNDGTVTIVGNATQAVSFSNAGPPLVVSKISTGDSAGKGPFRFHMECKDPAGAAIALDPADSDFTLNSGGVHPLKKDIPDGSTCAITEVANGGATSTALADTSGAGNDGTVTVKHGETQVATFTNDFAPQIKLVVTKTVSGSGTGPFRIQVTCNNNNAPVALGAGDNDFTLNAGESRSIKSIPNGAICTVTETDARGANRTYNESSGTANDGIVTIPTD
ncbi:MAG: hypothetical protein H0W70_12645, partial [Actinobacteria bacterium]|nr:hypothetical protein [Actinomycetota bacterium]